MQKDTDYPQGYNEAPDIDPGALPVDFVNEVLPEDKNVDVVNNQEPIPDTEED